MILLVSIFMNMNFTFMSKSKLFTFIALLFVVTACDNSEDCCLPIGDLENLYGNWQVYERGYSPGSGYIVDEVPDEPAQILTFESDNKFSSNYQGLEDFSYYLILNDNSGGFILSLYERKRDMKENQDINSLEHSYSIVYEDGNLKLYFRYCFEGCHIGLKKI